MKLTESHNYIKIGHTEKPHGIDGELKAIIDAAYTNDFEYLETVYLNEKNKPTPYFISSVRGGTKLIIKFEDIDTREAAVRIGSLEILVRDTDLVPADASDAARNVIQFNQCQGFTIHDLRLGAIGLIIEIITMPSQEMAVVNYNGKDKMIPLTTAFLTNIDAKAKIINMDLPDGLLDL